MAHLTEAFCNQDNDKHVGFPYVARPEARLLVLGTLPGAESLRLGQYYGKKQNAFWRIMGEVAGAGPELPYADRLMRLKACRIALWDVCRAAERQGSLDSAIRQPEANDFAAFFRAHRKIELIAFNGQGAAKLYRRLVWPDMGDEIKALPSITLPSTSPAFASKTYEQKAAEWRAALAFIGRR